MFPSLFRRAKKPDLFEILVVATVSAGKSTFINALVGQELLHAANEATTTCITSIEHCGEREGFAGASYSQAGNELAQDQNVTQELMREWNSKGNAARITLTGCFKGMPRLESGLRIYDTPGPNNGQNEQHLEAVQRALHSISFNAVFYVLNAGQLGTTDDRACLKLLLACARTAPVYFLLNKVDLLDPEKGEDMNAIVRNAQSYLVDTGFNNPIVVPIVADAALYARKEFNGQTRTRVQSAKLKDTLDQFSMDGRKAINAAIMPDAIRNMVSAELDRLDRLERQVSWLPKNWRIVRNRTLKQFIAQSGICTAETIIQYERSTRGKNESRRNTSQPFHR